MQFNLERKRRDLNVRADHPWYPTWMRLSTVEDLRFSLLEEIKNILIPLSLIRLKSFNVCSRAGALLLFIHSSIAVSFNFSPLFYT